MIKTIIIGKESNLSNMLNQNLNDCFLISSRDILENIEVLSQYKSTIINIIFNNFQPAIELNELKDPTAYIRNSILVTSMVLEHFNDTQINKIIYTSSSSVYGNNILCSEKDELKPMNLHSSLKISNEKLIEKYCAEKKIDYTITRIFNMYGGNDKFSIISKIITAHKEKKKISIINNGNAIRDFIHIDDVVEIYVKLLELKNIKLLNIGTGEGNSIKSILKFLSNHDIEIHTSNVFKDELKTSTADIQLLINAIKKDKFIQIEDYLKKEFVL